MSFFTQPKPIIIPEGAEHFLLSAGMATLAQSICLVYCKFNAECFVPELYQHLKVPSEPILQNAVMKRQSEFLAGRYVASVALEYLNIRSFALRIGQHRQPVWPKGVAGSISHTSTYAICVVSPSLSYLGIDIESLLEPKQAREISATVAKVDEYKKISDKGGGILVSL